MSSYRQSLPYYVQLEMFSTVARHTQAIQDHSRRLAQLEGSRQTSTTSASEATTARIRLWAASGSLGLVLLRLIPYLMLGSYFLKTTVWPWLRPLLL